MPDAALLDRARRGDLIRMGFAGGARVWWFDDPYDPIDDAQAGALIRGHNGQARYIEAGDCLFGWPGNSQTWISAFAD